MSTQIAITLLRAQFNGAHDWLEGTLGAITPEQVHWQPSGKAVPIGAHYAHILTAEDAFINGMLKGGEPILANSPTGLSELPPRGAWASWARELRVDLDATRAYAKKVYQATDAYIATLIDDDLGKQVDLGSIGFGTQTVAFVLTIMLGNVNNHCGEISTLKGLQGLPGYPM